MNSTAIEPLESRLAPAGLIAVSVTSAGILTLGTVAGQDGDEVVVISRLEDGGYQLAPGANVTLRLNGQNFTTPQTVYGVTGLTANLGAGSDSILLNSGYFAKGVNVNLGQGANGFLASNSIFGGTFMYTGGDGQDQLVFQDNVFSVGGATTIKLAGGNDSITFEVEEMNLGASLAIDGGAGDDTVSFGEAASVMGIVGNLTFTGGAGNDTLTLGATDTLFSVTGNVQMNDTAGNDSVLINGTRFSAGALLLQMGPGNNILTSTATDLFLAKNLKWTSTTGVDEVNIGGDTLRTGTSLDINIGTGAGEIFMQVSRNVHVGSTLTLTASATAALSREIVLRTGELTVTGKLTVSGGAGDGQLDIRGFDKLHLGAGAVFTAGAGTSMMALQTNAGLTSNGALSMTHSGNDGLLSIFSGGGSIINGAINFKGGDSISIFTNGVINGAVTLATTANPADDPSISISRNGNSGQVNIVGALKMTLPSNAAGAGELNLRGVVTQSTVSLIGGAGADTLIIDQSITEKGLTANLGAGADRFELEQTNMAGASFLRGAILLQGGAGADTFLIGGNTANFAITFSNKITVDGGAETDTLTIGTQATFNPAHPLIQLNIP